MKRFFIISSLFFVSLMIAASSWYLTKFNSGHTANNTANNKTDAGKKLMVELKTHADSVKPFLKINGYSLTYCFLIDMRIESGANRFFIYDLGKDSIIKEGLVTHGRCNKAWLTGRKYANEVGCGCTSLGKYKIGNSYRGRFGLAYKLHGLDSTNNNAFKRFVVLHAHHCVPNEQVNPAPICQSDGCPTVSEPFLQYLATIIDKSEKPVLLWIYDN